MSPEQPTPLAARVLALLPAAGDWMLERALLDAAKASGLTDRQTRAALLELSAGSVDRTVDRGFALFRRAPPARRLWVDPIGPGSPRTPRTGIATLGDAVATRVGR
jgi:hypothetical protein